MKKETMENKQQHKRKKMNHSQCLLGTIKLINKRLLTCMLKEMIIKKMREVNYE